MVKAEHDGTENIRCRDSVFKLVILNMRQDVYCLSAKLTAEVFKDFSWIFMVLIAEFFLKMYIFLIYKSHP